MGLQYADERRAAETVSTQGAGGPPDDARPLPQGQDAEEWIPISAAYQAEGGGSPLPPGVRCPPFLVRIVYGAGGWARLGLYMGQNWDGHGHLWTLWRSVRKVRWPARLLARTPSEHKADE